MNYYLPKSFQIGEREYPVRYDFRAVLDICAALEDPELDLKEKAIVACVIFYPEFEEIPKEYIREAVEKCYWFINGGEENPKKNGPRLVSWEKDVKHIIAPINRVLGREIRDIPEGGLHWWTFLAAYMEIGDCTFAQIVRIRNLMAKGKKLEKHDREWYRDNANLVNIPQKLTASELADMAEWGGKKGDG
jgi:hypothetical protein